MRTFLFSFITSLVAILSFLGLWYCTGWRLAKTDKPTVWTIENYGDHVSIYRNDKPQITLMGFDSAVASEIANKIINENKRIGN